MSKSIKKAFILLFVIVIITITMISTFFIIKISNDNLQIANVIDTYSDNYHQNKLQDTNTYNTGNLLLQINGENVVGVIQIDAISFRGLVYDDTSLKTLAKGVGHFKNSSYLEGNVCLAAHNTSKYWKKLYTLKNGEKITYTSFLGTKEYEVFSVKQIEETDWSSLNQTDKNILTLITCVSNAPTKRLCVQALEIN
ncbi:MAG: class D sortase [Clostridia bacterium]|nr:class D sortase [Clostridia bacterium]